jgi:hypothetical protein
MHGERQSAYHGSIHGAVHTAARPRSGSSGSNRNAARCRSFLYFNADPGNICNMAEIGGCPYDIGCYPIVVDASLETEPRAPSRSSIAIRFVLIG